MLISLDTAGHFVVGSKTQAFESENVSLGAVTAETTGPEGQPTPLATTPERNAANGTAKGNSTITGVQIFEGEAKDTFYGLRMNTGVAVFVVVILVIFV